MTQKIPKRIIQMDSRKNLPLLARGVIQNLRLLNPDFEYVFFDDAQIDAFIDTEFPQYRPIFNSFPARDSALRLVPISGDISSRRLLL